MDDTLVDFQEGLRRFNVFNNQGLYHHLPQSEWTTEQIKTDGKIVDCMNTKDFFLDLPPKEGFQELWKRANKDRNGYILTAYPKTCNDKARVAAEKLSWCLVYLEGFRTNQFIYCSREAKASYSDYGQILIDDLKPNIEAWERSNGTGILFKSSEQAIEELVTLGL